MIGSRKGANQDRDPRLRIQHKRGVLPCVLFVRTSKIDIHRLTSALHIKKKKRKKIRGSRPLPEKKVSSFPLISMTNNGSSGHLLIIRAAATLVGMNVCY